MKRSWPEGCFRKHVSWRAAKARVHAACTKDLCSHQIRFVCWFVIPEEKLLGFFWVPNHKNADAESIQVCQDGLFHVAIVLWLVGHSWHWHHAWWWFVFTKTGVVSSLWWLVVMNSSCILWECAFFAIVSWFSFLWVFCCWVCNGGGGMSDSTTSIVTNDWNVAHAQQRFKTQKCSVVSVVCSKRALTANTNWQGKKTQPEAAKEQFQTTFRCWWISAENISEQCNLDWIKMGRQQTFNKMSLFLAIAWTLFQLVDDDASCHWFKDNWH